MYLLYKYIHAHLKPLFVLPPFLGIFNDVLDAGAILIFCRVFLLVNKRDGMLDARRGKEKGTPIRR